MASDESATTVGQLQEAIRILAGVLLIAGWLVGIPAFLIVSNWGEPLLATETVQTVRYHGVLVDAAGPLFSWSGITFVFWMMATGRLPAPPR